MDTETMKSPFLNEKKKFFSTEIILKFLYIFGFTALIIIIIYLLYELNKNLLYLTEKFEQRIIPEIDLELEKNEIE